jgi:hypothetical protein
MKYHPTIHISHLKPYHGTSTPTEVRNPPPPQLINGEEHFYVEAFYKKRGTARKRSMLVKWQGYPEDLASWVEEAQLREDLDPATFTRLLSDLEARMAIKH